MPGWRPMLPLAVRMHCLRCWWSSRRLVCRGHPEPELHLRTGIRHNRNIGFNWQCKVGARVVGCCAHVASVLWYLGYWRLNPTQAKTPSLGYADTLKDAAKGWSSGDSASESQKEI
ncbi:uncharacterized protein TNCV_3904411 [Trichonephila clavipes]|nr:uncharacterized protein TNCV_3904411 [Trichonephila clavipes]